MYLNNSMMKIIEMKLNWLITEKLKLCKEFATVEKSLGFVSEALMFINEANHVIRQRIE